ncbi:transposable element Tcb2 transposase [Trichonephila clavipes]|nr:transposable element Tcb2 transposase [Trichonephila clavipes]
MINGRTRLHVVANGTMTGQRYIDEVLLPHVRLFRGAVGDKFVFMDDKVTCHRTLAVQDCLDSEGIQRLVWPARSPDLNPIENVWDALGRQVAGRNYPPTSVHSQRNRINCLNSCWIMLCKIWYDVCNVASHSTGYWIVCVRAPPSLEKDVGEGESCVKRSKDQSPVSPSPIGGTLWLPHCQPNLLGTTEQEGLGYTIQLEAESTPWKWPYVLPGLAFPPSF